MFSQMTTMLPAFLRGPAPGSHKITSIPLAERKPEELFIVDEPANLQLPEMLIFHLLVFVVQLPYSMIWWDGRR